MPQPTKTWHPPSTEEGAEGCASYVYLAPSPAEDFRSRGLWADRMSQVAQRFQRKEIGIYLSPEALADHRDCLETLLKKLASDGLVEKFYLLSGKHGVNRLFQAALGVRNDLSELDYLVFH